MKRNLLPTLTDLHSFSQDFYRPFKILQEDLNRAFSSSLENNFLPVNLKETEKEFILTAELPGIKKEDISISSNRDSIILLAEKKSEETKSEENMYYSEISYGKFERVVQLPGAVDQDNITAEYKEGTLKITVPKKDSQPQKRISIQ